MGYLYDAIQNLKSELIKRFERKKKLLEPFMNIVNSRWDGHLYKDLHAAGFWLNPSKQYDATEMEEGRSTISGLLDVIERYAYKNPYLRSKLTKEMRTFRNAEGDFGRISAISDRKSMQPDEWWMCYGSSAPNLQKLAIRILSQTCSSSGCERIWSFFEHIHIKKRNRLEHQRLNDLVYVRYNLRLQQRNYLKGRNYDPIDLDNFSNETWVLQDNPPPLTAQELEAFRQDMDASNVELNFNEGETLNLDEIMRDIDDNNDDEDGMGTEGDNSNTANFDLNDNRAMDFSSEEYQEHLNWTFG